ncbi:hypothetical protein FRB99_002787 [Tulasnella sp. 403]|nr:hypothetical protein FRB99_002787 [Tulasnella sp. 403]
MSDEKPYPRTRSLIKLLRSLKAGKSTVKGLLHRVKAVRKALPQASVEQLTSMQAAYDKAQKAKEFGNEDNQAAAFKGCLEEIGDCNEGPGARFARNAASKILFGFGFNAMRSAAALGALNAAGFTSGGVAAGSLILHVDKHVDVLPPIKRRDVGLLADAPDSSQTDTALVQIYVDSSGQTIDDDAPMSSQPLPVAPLNVEPAPPPASPERAMHPDPSPEPPVVRPRARFRELAEQEGHGPTPSPSPLPPSPSIEELLRQAGGIRPPVGSSTLGSGGSVAPPSIPTPQSPSPEKLKRARSPAVDSLSTSPSPKKARGGPQIPPSSPFGMDKTTTLTPAAKMLRVARTTSPTPSPGRVEVSPPRTPPLRGGGLPVTPRPLIERMGLAVEPRERSPVATQAPPPPESQGSLELDEPQPSEPVLDDSQSSNPVPGTPPKNTDAPVSLELLLPVIVEPEEEVQSWHGIAETGVFGPAVRQSGASRVGYDVYALASVATIQQPRCKDDPRNE